MWWCYGEKSNIREGKRKQKQKGKDIIKERNREKVKQKEKICPHVHKIIQ